MQDYGSIDAVISFCFWLYSDHVNVLSEYMLRRVWWGGEDMGTDNLNTFY